MISRRKSDDRARAREDGDVVTLELIETMSSAGGGWTELCRVLLLLLSQTLWFMDNISRMQIISMFYGHTRFNRVKNPLKLFLKRVKCACQIYMSQFGHRSLKSLPATQIPTYFDWYMGVRVTDGCWRAYKCGQIRTSILGVCLDPRKSGRKGHTGHCSTL